MQLTWTTADVDEYIAAMNVQTPPHPPCAFMTLTNQDKCGNGSSVTLWIMDVMEGVPLAVLNELVMSS